MSPERAIARVAPDLPPPVIPGSPPAFDEDGSFGFNSPA